MFFGKLAKAGNSYNTNDIDCGSNAVNLISDKSECALIERWGGVGGMNGNFEIGNLWISADI